MGKIAKDEVREDRINMEAIVDANGAEEQAIGWYYYLSLEMAKTAHYCADVIRTLKIEKQ